MHPEESDANTSDHTHGEYEIPENQKRYYPLTTDQVRAGFLEEPEYWFEDAGDEWAPGPTKKDFDRWLAEVKAQAKAQALEKVADDLASMAGWNAQEAETILLAQKRIRALSQTFLDGENSE